MDVSKHLAGVASCISNPARAAMLWSLMGGESRPASELAILANISPQTASNHLKDLVEAGLLEVSPSGRNKFYRLRGPGGGAPPLSPVKLPPSGGGPRGNCQKGAPPAVWSRARLYPSRGGTGGGRLGGGACG